jgi:acyl-CoA synthetase (AMP-forming)/AMP-acid ligase II
MESWNAESAVDLIDRHGGTMTVAATPFLQELVDAARLKNSRLESFRVFACGGAPVPPDLIRRANAAFAHHCAFRVYGSSEAPFVSLGYMGNDAELAATSDGRILDYEVRIVDADGRDADEGEILVRGPALFRGYSDPAQTLESFTPDGYFKTGDVGRRGIEGTLTITDRIKDIIIRGGENISTKEIEDALHRHDEIAEAAVVAAPHERLGEGIFAYIVVRSGTAPTPAALCAFLEQSGLARQKLPEGFAIVDSLPRTASGKIRKDLLRARLAPVEGL